MRQSFRALRNNIAAISAAVRASGEYTRAAATVDGKQSETRSAHSGIPI